MVSRHGVRSLWLALVATVLGSSAAAAELRAPAVSVVMISSPTLTLDSNRPCTEGPRAAFVAFRVSNPSGAAQRNLTATLSGFAGGIALQSGQAASQYLGTLGPGQSRVVYWFVSYPCTFGVSTMLTASVTDGTPGAATGSGTVTTASMISAQAGGVLVSGLLGPGAVVGQTIHLDVEYEFGGASAGTTYNLQPAGNTAFDAGCFQMVGSLVTASNVTAVPVGAANQSYFVAGSRQNGSGFTLTVRYFFKYLCAGVVTSARPYSDQLSGTQLKYSSNYETFVGPTLPGATIGFTVAKSATPDTLPRGGTATYTVTVRNVSAFTAEVDSIADQLPAGVVYAGLAPGSGVTLAGSSAAPAAGATGRLVWRGPFSVPAGGTLTLVYTAAIPSAPADYVNTATGYTGLTVLGSSSATVTVALRLAVGVDPQGLASPAARLEGTGYAQTFTVTNRSNDTESFDLLARAAGAAGAVAAVDSVSGAALLSGGPDGPRVSLAVGQSATVTVWYSVAAGDPAADSLLLRARSVTDAAVLAEGWAELRRVAPSVAMAKLVSPGGTVLPGDELTYSLQIHNQGEAEAHEVVVVDSLPAELMIRVGSVQETLPAGVSATVDFSSDDGASWSHTPASGACGAPAGYDACVRMIRWTLAGTLPADLVQSAGTLRFLALVR